MRRTSWAKFSLLLTGAILLLPLQGFAATQISVLPFTISQPGSYVVSQNLTSSGDGISVQASNVAIDLNGFTLSGSGSGNGVVVTSGSNIQISNGTITGFTSGVEVSEWNNNVRVASVNAIGNSLWGIHLFGTNNQVKGCTVTGSSYIGIRVGSGSRVEDNNLFNNGHGIIATDGNTTIAGNTVTSSLYNGITNGVACLVKNNTVTYSASYGIATNAGSLYDGNVTYGNLVNITGCSNCSFGLNAQN
ncbi:hypothetical protein Geob_1141 [Geotalea daltonii FRC-32]|uniref:Right handed beta helix domain-containing protein n=1 Tax=Geotalea daltonii (strain DSM 22248 / JCM 15807 / FRC-32) TaxID=316067 RepID=B9M391_GEODF|nr:right-handed parallel beta-helix repeat-containing protein [Geotalea daltonii]ACM19501.1 hypothetical protein Geob_1141 [Geotalea daltonii FRC-32]